MHTDTNIFYKKINEKIITTLLLVHYDLNKYNIQDIFLPGDVKLRFQLHWL